MASECVIISATITSAAITARASRVTFSMTTRDPAQVGATRAEAHEACSTLGAIKGAQEVHNEVWC